MITAAIRECAQAYPRVTTDKVNKGMAHSDNNNHNGGDCDTGNDTSIDKIIPYLLMRGVTDLISSKQILSIDYIVMNPILKLQRYWDKPISP